MYRFDELREVHLEVTSRCNARCPMCARNVFGGRVSPLLPLSEIGVEQARAIFDESFVRQLEMLVLCGNYGDPVVAQDTAEIAAWFRAHNARMTIAMHTNGSGRASSWWRRLAALGVRVHFGIDGLEDTNAVYRRGTDWAAIMRSVRAFIDAGGDARWEMIVFRHNEHQVDDARRLSRQLGFRKFKIKKTNRFFRGGLVSRRFDGKPALDVDPRFPILDDAGLLEGTLEMPKAAVHRNPGLEVAMGCDGVGFKSLRDEVEIDCRAVRDATVYVSAERLVFPCCYVANVYAPTTDPSTHPTYRLLSEVGGPDAIRVPGRTLREVVEGPFFEAIAASWSRPTVEAGRLKTCARVCGGARNMYRKPYARATDGP